MYRRAKGVIVSCSLIIWKNTTAYSMPLGSSDGACHQVVPGSNPRPGAISGLSLLALYSAPRGFSPGFPLSKYQHLI